MYPLKTLPENERPRERLLQRGAEALTTAELLAIILRSGTQGKSVLNLAQELLSHYGSLSKVYQASVEDLCQIKGLGETKAIQLKAALALAPRLREDENEATFQIVLPRHAYAYVRDRIVYEKKEMFGVLLLNVRSEVLKWQIVSVGTLTQTLVHPREVFAPAIQASAASVILVHNHPSGDLTPSPQDIRVTRTLLEASHHLSLPIYDHLIVSQRGFYSLREHIKDLPFL